MITRPGANNLAVDPKSLMMYYSTGNDKKIVREPLSFDTPAGTEESMCIVTPLVAIRSKSLNEYQLKIEI